MSKTAAFFDIDGTLLDSTIVHFYAHLSTAEMSPRQRAWWTIRFAPWIPVLMAVDMFSRAAFNRMFYRFYKGMEAERLFRLMERTAESFALPKMFPEAKKTLERHAAQGHETALVTGTAEMIAAPLGRLLEASGVMAVQLEVSEGRFTGELTTPPLSGEAKADAARAFAAERGIDLSASYAYGDSMADAELLRLTGHPTAVNPSRGLRSLAKREGWPVKRWRRG